MHTSDHLPSHHLGPRLTSSLLQTPHSIATIEFTYSIALLPDLLHCAAAILTPLRCHRIHCLVRIHITIMSKNAPPSEATLPAVGDSPSSLISAAAVADVELTISPDAADPAAAASGSKVSLSFYFHLILHMNSYYI